MSAKGSLMTMISGFPFHKILREAIEQYRCRTENCIWQAMCDVVEQKGKQRPRGNRINAVRRIIALSKDTDKYGFRVQYLNKDWKGYYVVTGPEAMPLDEDARKQLIGGHVTILEQSLTYSMHCATLMDDAIQYSELPDRIKEEFIAVRDLHRTCAHILRSAIREVA